MSSSLDPSSDASLNALDSIDALGLDGQRGLDDERHGSVSLVGERKVGGWVGVGIWVKRERRWADREVEVRAGEEIAGCRGARWRHPSS